MSSIVNALSDLVSSLVEVVWSFFTTALHLVENTAQFVARFATEILQLIVNFFKGLVDLAGGLVSFIVGNVVMVGALAAVFFGFLQYQRSQGREVKVGNKKLN